MNISIRFEDAFGCRSLYESFKGDQYVKGDLSTSVFNITKSIAKKYDLIICVFDLDSVGDKSLMITPERFIERTTQVLKYVDKVVLVPVFFCFETLVLFSSQLRNLISMPSKFRRGDTANTLVRYKEQYDYSVLVPEFLDNYKEKMGLIKPDKDIFYPQEFHQSYMRELLRSLYLKANSDEIRKKSKNIDLLFEYFKDFQLSGDNVLTYDSILNGLIDYAGYNQEFLNLLLCPNLDNMIQYAGKANYDRIVNLMDTYRIKLEGGEDELDLFHKPIIAPDFDITSVKRLKMF